MATFTNKVGASVMKVVIERAKVQEMLAQNTQRAFMRIGAWYRPVVKRSMRPGNKRGDPSQPGQPPRYHTKRLRDGIYFAYDTQTQTVVVGATPNRSPLVVGSRKIPEALEHGGVIRYREYAYVRPGGFVSRRPGRQGRRVLLGNRAANIVPRPFVGANSVNYPKVVKFKDQVIKDKLLK